MADDPFVSAARRVGAAGREACDAIEATINAFERLIQARLAGASHVDIADDPIGREARAKRLASVDAFREYERAVGAMRASLVCVLVDEYGLSLTDVANRLTVSRQAVARLYQNGREALEGPSDR